MAAETLFGVQAVITHPAEEEPSEFTFYVRSLCIPAARLRALACSALVHQASIASFGHPVDQLHVESAAYNGEITSLVEVY